MLPDFETCWKHINIYNLRVKVTRPNTVNFQVFWEYKSGLEKGGQNILDARNIEKTAALLRGLSIYLKKQKSGIVSAKRLAEILTSLRPFIAEIDSLKLGSRQMPSGRGALEAAYRRLGNFNREAESAGGKSSIVSASEILMAVWGQVPRFDLLARTRFKKWTHAPEPLNLPALEPEVNWYRPSEFGAIMEELDRWVAAWPANNQGRSFPESFYDLCPGAPAGRLVDIIYHWEYPDPRVDYRLQSQGS
jgi:hypothetical protein